MRFNRHSPARQLLFASITFTAIALGVNAQDTIIQTNNASRTGQITGVRNGNVMIKFGPGEIGIPLNQISSVTMATPAGVATGLAFQEGGKPADALAALKPVVESFGGLPTDWAQKTAAAIGDLYLSLGKNEDAAAAYQKFKQLYPAAGLSLQADVGMARVALASGKADEAKKTLEPILAGASAKADVTKAESAAYGQAAYTLGTIAEKEGKLAEALQNYLLTVTVFYEDRSITARAQERADAIRKENTAIAVP